MRVTYDSDDFEDWVSRIKDDIPDACENLFKGVEDKEELRMEILGVLERFIDDDDTNGVSYMRRTLGDDSETLSIWRGALDDIQDNISGLLTGDTDTSAAIKRAQQQAKEAFRLDVMLYVYNENIKVLKKKKKEIEHKMEMLNKQNPSYSTFAGLKDISDLIDF